MTPREPEDPSLEEVEHDFSLPADADLRPAGNDEADEAGDDA